MIIPPYTRQRIHEDIQRNIEYVKDISPDYYLVTIENCPSCKILKRHLSSMFEIIELRDRSVGFGDTIHRLTDLLRIKQCSRCINRHYWLNTVFPYWWTSKKDRDIRKKMLKGNKSTSAFPCLLHKQTNNVLDMATISPHLDELIRKYI